MATHTLLRKLYELRLVLDRLAQTDTTLHEALTHDVDEAIRLADECIGELADAPAEEIAPDRALANEND